MNTWLVWISNRMPAVYLFNNEFTGASCLLTKPLQDQSGENIFYLFHA